MYVMYNICICINNIIAVCLCCQYQDLYKIHTCQALGLPTDTKAVVKHVLSKELQMYYEKMTEAILGCVKCWL